MANPEKGEVGIVVGGKSYILRPAFNSVCELEDLVGKPHTVIEAEIKSGRLSGLRAVVWCLLHDVHRHEIRTLEDAAKWIIAAGGPGVVMDLVTRVFTLNEPETPQEPAADPPTAQADGTGEPSSSVLVGSV